MGRPRFGPTCLIIALACLLIGCRATEKKAAQPEPVEPKPAPVAVDATGMTDDALCAWMCANCYREYAGLLEYPGDCRGECKSQITTGRCPEPMRAKVLCQVQNQDCDACEGEKQAALQCLRDCSKIEREQGKEDLPEHCRVKTPQP